MYDVAIIGAGVIGAAIARELSRYDISIVILEKENDVSAGTSKANTGIIHAGYDPEENTLMAELNAKGNKMFDAICDELSVPFKRNGSLVVAFDDEQMIHINALMQRGISNGISDLRIISRDELSEKEPAINPEARGALFAETAGIIDPMLLTISLLENAAENGVETIFGFCVESIERKERGWRINSLHNSVDAKIVINAAGVYADSINNMVRSPAFKINPVQGQYFLLDKCEGSMVNATIFPCPTKAGKGILIVPTVHGNILVGPTSESVSDKEDVSTSDDVLRKLRAGVKHLIPELSFGNNIRNFSGLRAEACTGDFIIGAVKGTPGFINAAGIKSPGLTAAPAIALLIVSILGEINVNLQLKSSFNPSVKRKLLIDMPLSEQTNAIKHNPLYGRVICRCENITEGDIVDSIWRNPGAVTMDGVKLRCRAGMGRCQSGFCGPKVQQIIARELGIPLDKVVLNKKGSYILTGRTK